MAKLNNNFSNPRLVVCSGILLVFLGSVWLGVGGGWGANANSSAGHDSWRCRTVFLEVGWPTIFFRIWVKLSGCAELGVEAKGLVGCLR